MAMCRITTVTKARNEQPSCGHCHTAILAGQPYRWWKGRYTSKRVRCMRPGCTPERWELETNPLRQDAMRCEAAVDHARGVEDAQSVATYLRDAIGYAEAIVEALDERLGNWQSTNFEYSEQYLSCETSKEEFEYWASQADDVASALESLMPEPPDITDLPEGASDDDLADAEQEYAIALEDALADLDDVPELDLGA